MVLVFVFLGTSQTFQIPVVQMTSITYYWVYSFRFPSLNHSNLIYLYQKISNPQSSTLSHHQLLFHIPSCQIITKLTDVCFKCWLTTALFLRGIQIPLALVLPQGNGPWVNIVSQPKKPFGHASQRTASSGVDPGLLWVLTGQPGTCCVQTQEIHQSVLPECWD
jgi:hypothetical protein